MYAHLNQIQEKDLNKAVSAATELFYYNNPMHLEMSNVFFLKLLPEPPTGMLKSFIYFTLILFVYLYPIIRGLIIFWVRLLGAYINSKENTNFVQHGQRRCRTKQQNELSTMHVKFFSTKRPNEESFAWDTNGLPFVVDN